MTRILVVDDDPAICSFIAEALISRGHTVRTAADGSEALQLLQDELSDLVLTDLYMPNVDGMEFARQLRREFVGIRLIAMSGGVLQQPEEALAVAKMLGAAGTLAKPFTVQELYEAVDAALRGES